MSERPQQKYFQKIRSLAMATALVLGGAALNSTDALSEVANTGAQISDEAKRKILSLNARRILARVER